MRFLDVPRPGKPLFGYALRVASLSVFRSGCPERARFQVFDTGFSVKHLLSAALGVAPALALCVAVTSPSPLRAANLSVTSGVYTVDNSDYSGDTITVTNATLNIIDNGNVNYTDLFNSVMNVDGGFNYFSQVQAGSTLNLIDGSVRTAYGYGGTINVSGGFMDDGIYLASGQANLIGGFARIIYAHFGSVNVTGGSATVVDNDGELATVSITGGSVEDLAVRYTAHTSVHGGTIYNFHAFDDGVFDLYGTDLSYTLVGWGNDFFAHSLPWEDGNVPYTLYALSGTLADGTSLAGRYFYDHQAGLTEANPTTTQLRFFPIPEPSTLGLLLAAAAGVVMRRRCSLR
jgi:hypothetical protein